MRRDGRLRLYLAMAYLHTDMAEKAAEIIKDGFVLSDVKEGELSVSVLWFEIYGKIVKKNTGFTGERLKEEVRKLYPLPYSLDFRMHD